MRYKSVDYSMPVPTNKYHKSKRTFFSLVFWIGCIAFIDILIEFSDNTGFIFAQSTLYSSVHVFLAVLNTCSKERLISHGFSGTFRYVQVATIKHCRILRRHLHLKVPWDFYQTAEMSGPFPLEMWPLAVPRYGRT